MYKIYIYCLLICENKKNITYFNNIQPIRNKKAASDFAMRLLV